MDHYAVAAAVHAQAKAYLARFGHEATLGDDYAILMTREATAEMRVLLQVDGVERSMLVKLPVGDADRVDLQGRSARSADGWRAASLLSGSVVALSIVRSFAPRRQLCAPISAIR